MRTKIDRRNLSQNSTITCIFGRSNSGRLFCCCCFLVSFKFSGFYALFAITHSVMTLMVACGNQLKITIFDRNLKAFCFKIAPFVCAHLGIEPFTSIGHKTPTNWNYRKVTPFMCWKNVTTVGLLAHHSVRDSLALSPATMLSVFEMQLWCICKTTKQYPSTATKTKKMKKKRKSTNPTIYYNKQPILIWTIQTKIKMDKKSKYKYLHHTDTITHAKHICLLMQKVIIYFYWLII